MGAWYLGRTPTHYARTVLLLTIAGALAVFAASFRTTLDSSYDDRALHSVGASVRLIEPHSEAVPFEAIERLSGQSVARVKRIVGAYDGDEDSGRLQIVALDAQTVAEQLAERDADWALPPEALSSIAPSRSDVQRAVIEDFGGLLTLRLRVLFLAQATPIGIKVQDAHGRYWWYTIETLETPSAEEFSATLRLTDEADAYLPLEGARTVQRQSSFRPGVTERPVAPLTLASLDLAVTRAPGEIILRDLRYEHSGQSQILADFASGRWEATPLEVGEQPLDAFRIEDGGAHYRWSAIPASLRGVRYVSERAPLPALLSVEAMEQGRLTIGETVRIRVGPTPVKFNVVGQFETFPGYDPQRDEPLVLIDRAAFVQRLYGSAAAGVALAVDDELWASAPLSSWSELLVEREIPLDAEGIDTLGSARSELAADPLIVASWNGVFIGALAAVAIASAFGLVVLTAVTSQARRVEFAVCRSVGMSMRQILGLIALEQLIVIAIGLGAGLIVGSQAGAILLDFFALTPDGRDVVPRLTFIIDWPGVGILFAALTGLFALNLGAFLYFLRRIELHGALRLAA